MKWPNDGPHLENYLAYEHPWFALAARAVVTPLSREQSSREQCSMQQSVQKEGNAAENIRVDNTVESKVE